MLFQAQLHSIETLTFTADNLINFLDTYSAPEEPIHTCNQVRKLENRKDRRTVNRQLRAGKWES